MANKDDHKMRCSFCGKPQDMVYKLITGPGVCICDECVELCNSILYDEEDLDPLEKTKRKKQDKNKPVIDPASSAGSDPASPGFRYSGKAGTAPARFLHARGC